MSFSRTGLFRQQTGLIGLRTGLIRRRIKPLRGRIKQVHLVFLFNNRVEAGAVLQTPS